MSWAIAFPSGMGLNRLLTKSGDIPKEWQETLDRSLGDGEWRVGLLSDERKRLVRMIAYWV